MDGRNIQRAIEAAGLSDAEVARELGLNQSAVFRVKRRAHVRRATAERYLSAIEGCVAQRNARLRESAERLHQLADSLEAAV